MPEGKLEKNLYFVDSSKRPLEGEDNEVVSADFKDFLEMTVEGEVEKSPELVNHIEWLALELRETIKRQIEIEPIEITPSMIHILPRDLCEKNYNRDYEVNPAFCNNQGIFICEEFLKEQKNNLLAILDILTHEFLHLYAVTKHYIVATDDTIEIRDQLRQGWSIRHGKPVEEKEEFHFKGWDEMITDRLNVDFFRNNIRQHPKYRELAIERDKRLLSAEEIEEGMIVISEGNSEYEFLSRLFSDMVEKIYELNHDKFDDQNQVYYDLVRPYFSARLKPTAKLINSLGRDCFRDLADFENKKDINQAKAIIDFRKKYNLSDDPRLQEFINAGGDEDLVKAYIKY
ncbi:MAG: hypothetical protein AAB358_01800 [Patescibacteria group bacterium]